MVIFNSYVKLPEGMMCFYDHVLGDPFLSNHSGSPQNSPGTAGTGGKLQCICRDFSGPRLKCEATIIDLKCGTDRGQNRDIFSGQICRLETWQHLATIMCFQVGQTNFQH